MYVEIIGHGDCALWLDISLDLTMCGILVDCGPVYGGWFISVVDMINLVTL